MQIKDYLSELDTERFGFKIAKIHRFDFELSEIIQFLKSKKIKLIITKVCAEDLEMINKLETYNFIIKDIQVTYRYDLKNYHPSFTWRNSDFILRDIEAKDIYRLEKIAMESFKNYGHYAADKRLDNYKSNEIYKDWIRRSYEDKTVADKIIVAEHAGAAVGFLSFKIFTGDGKYAAGGLGAVASEYRNRDVFRMINVAGLNWGTEINLQWI